MKITAVVLSKNEAKNITQCLRNLDFCDEKIVVDDNSDDETVSLAEKSGAKVFTRSLGKDFAAQRNFGLEKASEDWVLFIDPDERVSNELRDEILEILKNPFSNTIGYFLKRKDFVGQKEIKHGEGGENYKLRLAKKDAGTWRRRVHEYWNIKGEKAYLKGILRHYPYQTLNKFFSRINFYSSLHARANHEEGKHSSLIKIIFWPIFKFIKSYFFKLGFLDGTEGFLLATFMGFHSFLSWSKLWIIEKNFGFPKK